MAVKVLILEDNPVARSFLCRVVRESFSDTIVITEAGWCSVFHHSTENLMIGRLIAPSSVRIAAARALRPGPSTVR